MNQNIDSSNKNLSEFYRGKSRNDEALKELSDFVNKVSEGGLDIFLKDVLTSTATRFVTKKIS